VKVLSTPTDVLSQEYPEIHKQQPQERWKILGTVAMTLSTSMERFGVPCAGSMRVCLQPDAELPDLVMRSTGEAAQKQSAHSDHHGVLDAVAGTDTGDVVAEEVTGVHLIVDVGVNVDGPDCVVRSWARVFGVGSKLRSQNSW